MLQADNVDIIEIQKIRSLPIGVDLLLTNLKPNLIRIVVPFGYVVDRCDKDLGTSSSVRQGLAEVVSERRDTTTARDAVANKGNTL